MSQLNITIITCVGVTYESEFKVNIISHWYLIIVPMDKLLGSIGEAVTPCSGIAMVKQTSSPPSSNPSHEDAPASLNSLQAQFSGHEFV